MVVVLVVSIVRKVAQSEWDCSLTNKLATVSVGHFSLEKRRLKIPRQFEFTRWTKKRNALKFFGYNILIQSLDVTFSLNFGYNEVRI